MDNTRNDVVSRSTKAYARTLGDEFALKATKRSSWTAVCADPSLEESHRQKPGGRFENMGPVYAEASNKLPYRSTKPKSAKQISKVLKKRPQDYNRSAEYIAGLS